MVINDKADTLPSLGGREICVLMFVGTFVHKHSKHKMVNYHIIKVPCDCVLQTIKLEDRVKDRAILLSNRSFCFLRMGRGEDAVSDATSCIEYLPYWPKGYYRQGAAYMLLKVKIIVTLNFL